MKRILLLGIALLMGGWVMAHSADSTWRGVDNTMIYEHFASRTDLRVSQIIHFPLDSGIFVNMVSIQAPDSTTFESLTDEFFMAKFPEETLTFMQKSDFYGLTLTTPIGDDMEMDSKRTCGIVGLRDKLTILICSIANDGELSALIDYFLSLYFQKQNL